MWSVISELLLELNSTSKKRGRILRGTKRQAKENKQLIKECVQADIDQSTNTNGRQRVRVKFAVAQIPGDLQLMLLLFTSNTLDVKL